MNKQITVACDLCINVPNAVYTKEKNDDLSNYTVAFTRRHPAVIDQVCSVKGGLNTGKYKLTCTESHPLEYPSAVQH